MTNENTVPRPSVQYITVSDAHEGQRVDNFLLRQLKGVPKSRVYRILRKGEVRVNKSRVKPEYKLCIGDVVRVPPVRVSVGHGPSGQGRSMPPAAPEDCRPSETVPSVQNRRCE